MNIEKNSFICSKGLFVFALILGFINLTFFSGFFEIDILYQSPDLITWAIMLLLTDVFIIYLIIKCVYMLKFDEYYLYQYKFGRLINQCKLDDIKMICRSNKTYSVEITGINIEGKKVSIVFDYNRRIGKIISKYYKKRISNLHKTFNDLNY